ncbi:hypothetical protein BGX21_000312 [Mortierella sp. AD011]|nr:hypothetical protein BGX20_005118 [Mortierella sp. AD010]KAF9401869.1 hypothetical protein BGX21_000312 [Mortierella sp. AD011]
MLGRQQLLQRQHQHIHAHQHRQQQQQQQQLGYQDSKSSGSHTKQLSSHLPVSNSSTSSTVSASGINTKPSPANASLPPAYLYLSRSTTPVSAPSLSSVSSPSATLASASGDTFMGTGENFVPNIKRAKYSTSLDPRGFIPVFEYELYGHPIMWDQENMYVHFTGIWKALGKTKADIVKIIDANPILESIIRKVRGGFLKIQGTWMPHQEAYDLAKKTCYKLRYELAPVFGPGFVNDCIPPDTQGFGSILLTMVRRRASECVMYPNMGPQQLRLHQTHIHPSLKRRHSSNDVSRLSRFSQPNGPTSSQLASSLLLNQSREYQQSGGDGDQDDDLGLNMSSGDLDLNRNRNTVAWTRQHRFRHTGRSTWGGSNDDGDEDDEDRLLDGSTEDEEERQSLSGSCDGDDIDIDGESCTSEQDDPMYDLARLDLSRRNSSPMPLSAAYALSGSSFSTKSSVARTKRGRPPTRRPMPAASRINANYVAYNNYVSSNTQVAQGLSRSNGHSTRAQKQQQQFRQQPKLQDQIQQQQRSHPLQMPVSQQSSLDQERPPCQRVSSAPAMMRLTHQELVEFFKAGQALQRMSQDDGIRPWKQDGDRMILPKKIVLGEQVFQCVGGEYKCVPEPNNSSSIKPPGERDGWSR